MQHQIPGEAWQRKTIDFAISVMRLIHLMRCRDEVELRSPARICPSCKNQTEVIVVPSGLCGDCWSKQAIAAWKVGPTRAAAAD